MHDMTAYGEGGGEAYLHSFSTVADGVVIFTPRPLCSQESTPVPTEYEPGWASEPV
jgi:hypothetical protein